MKTLRTLHRFGKCQITLLEQQICLLRGESVSATFRSCRHKRKWLDWLSSAHRRDRQTQHVLTRIQERRCLRRLARVGAFIQSGQPPDAGGLRYVAPILAWALWSVVAFSCVQLAYRPAGRPECYAGYAPLFLVQRPGAGRRQVASTVRPAVWCHLTGLRRRFTPGLGWVLE